MPEAVSSHILTYVISLDDHVVGELEEGCGYLAECRSLGIDQTVSQQPCYNQW